MFTFTVEPDDSEPFTVTATSRDIATWERTGQNRSFAGLMDDLKMSELYAIAHTAARRQQLFDGSLQDMLRTCELDFKMDEEETDAPDPTREGRSTGSSSNSRSRPASRRVSGSTKATVR